MKVRRGARSIFRAAYTSVIIYLQPIFFLPNVDELFIKRG